MMMTILPKDHQIHLHFDNKSVRETYPEKRERDSTVTELDFNLKILNF